MIISKILCFGGEVSICVGGFSGALVGFISVAIVVGGGMFFACLKLPWVVAELWWVWGVLFAVSFPPTQLGREGVLGFWKRTSTWQSNLCCRLRAHFGVVRLSLRVRKTLFAWIDDGLIFILLHEGWCCCCCCCCFFWKDSNLIDCWSCW